MRAAAVLAPLLALAACGDYVPAVRADHGSASYRTDVAACQKQGSTEADRRAKAHGALFLSYPVSFPLLERRLIARCMHDRGYVDES